MCYRHSCTLKIICSVTSCPGASPGTDYANRCLPYHIWSGTKAAEGYVDRDINSGKVYGPSIHDITYAFSVRCLLLARYPATYRAGMRLHPYCPRMRCAVSFGFDTTDKVQ